MKSTKMLLVHPDKSKWIDVLSGEANNMKDYEVRDLIDKSKEETPLNCTWVFRVKTEVSNQPEQHKARLCVQGFKEVFGRDYNRTYAPTGKLVSLCLLITFAGETKHLLGMKVEQSETEIRLTQTHYIEETILKYGCSELIPLATPMKPNSHLVKASKEEVDELIKLKFHYRGLVGALNYLSVTTRPDITYVVGCLSQFLKTPGILHWNAAVHTLRYLKGSKDFGITLRKTPINDLNFEAFVDASWASCQITGKSTTGYLILWNDNLISWRSKKQATHSLSSTEAECIAITEVTKELTWLKMVTETALKITIPSPTPIFEDNQGAILLANNEANHSAFKTKHMNLRFHFVRSEVIADNMTFIYKRTHEMLADFLTKSIGRSSIFKILRVLQAVTSDLEYGSLYQISSQSDPDFSFLILTSRNNDYNYKLRSINPSGSLNSGVTLNFSEYCAGLQGLRDGFCGCLSTISTFFLEVYRAGPCYKTFRYALTSWISGQFLCLMIFGIYVWIYDPQERCAFPT
ncbi:hypothetical protein MJO28_013629 [Puccinia striiformis f. sp. tritici]|uniref:Uncharacterized protein n=1 Tax=Puccinia striiformis f. sp. tritici TaxID=168172 RepID=A0ACC0DV10_9BASI|nr:hypothetical protein MJO28_013629 [Puccinia striiformis f. sp. tritici]